MESSETDQEWNCRNRSDLLVECEDFLLNAGQCSLDRLTGASLFQELVDKDFEHPLGMKS